MPNRLAHETSPYLLQHKDNPVDWYPWCDEAFEKARAEDKPVFLSVGYSACHWCHVMEHESFEDEEIAKLMNEHFVNIKVDREERPDVDSIYMAAVQAMTGQGGWPMSVFLTPEGKPFYAGTYFPKDDYRGMPGFPRVLQALAEAYKEKKDQVATTSAQVVDHLSQFTQPKTSDDPLTRDVLHQAYQGLADSFDAENGGFGNAPKFPQPMLYEYLLRVWADSGEEGPLAMVRTTLDNMARGGMYDQLGGGFHRYSTDGVWLVPHFEKMLYDNALLPPLYLHAWQATGKEFYKRIAEEILAYVEREMLDPSGGFYSSQDADSEGVEGKFFVWSAQEVASVLGEDLGVVAAAYWGVSPTGNWEGSNILWVPRSDEKVAEELGLSVDELHGKVEEARRRLFEARESRVHPGRDDKVLTSWNALMGRAFAEAGAILENDRYIDVARRNAEFLLSELVRDGRVLRTWKATGPGNEGQGSSSDAGASSTGGAEHPSSGAEGAPRESGRAAEGGQGHPGEGKLNGYLEDYSCLVDALTVLYESTFEGRWLSEASRLANAMIDLFWDADDEIFYDTGADHEQLLVRPRDFFDNAQPCGSSVASYALLRLATLTGDESYEAYAAKPLQSVREFMLRAPTGFANWLAALDYYTGTPKEIVVVGQPDQARPLLDVVHSRYIPNKVVGGILRSGESPATPLLESREAINGAPTAYVCENYACQMPVTEPSALAEQLM